jgi:hypothetical protein|tara:strand:- start:5 stop:178 length:174 start_codon:yes stop_codon:yes gene_type:complete
MMYIEVSASELLMLKEMFDNDIEMSCMDYPDYRDEDAMRYYLDRCRVYNKIEEELST